MTNLYLEIYVTCGPILQKQGSYNKINRRYRLIQKVTRVKYYK